MTFGQIWCSVAGRRDVLWAVPLSTTFNILLQRYGGYVLFVVIFGKKLKQQLNKVVFVPSHRQRMFYQRRQGVS